MTTMAELNLQAIKDRVARGRLQGGNPTGGEDGPFHLYHLALDDLDALIAVADPEAAAAKDARIIELEAQLAETRKAPEPQVFDPVAPFPIGPDGRATFGTLDVVGTDGGKASVETLQSPRVADLSDEERAKLLSVAEEYKE